MRGGIVEYNSMSWTKIEKEYSKENREGGTKNIAKKSWAWARKI